MKLTKSLIDKMAFEGKDVSATDIRWDDAIPGFGVRVWPTGKKTFVVRYRFQGRRRYLTLGRYGVITLEEARRLAQTKLAEVIQGRDPLDEKLRGRREKTVEDLAAEYLDRHGPHKRSLRDDRRYLEKVLIPEFGKRRISSIRKADIANLHSSIGREHPTTANRILALVSVMFNLAKHWGYVEDNFPNPAKGIKRFKEKKRDRYVTHTEMPSLVETLEAEKNIYLRSLFWLYLLTGLRKTSLKNLKWEDIDVVNKTICLKPEDVKEGKPHYLPLSDFAFAIFESIPRQFGNPYVFCGRVPGQPLVNVNKAWARIRKAAKIDDVRIHDLRHTVASWSVMSGKSLELIGQIFNHSNTQTTKRYAHFALNPMREALKEHSAAIISVTTKPVQAPSAVD